MIYVNLAKPTTTMQSNYIDYSFMLVPNSRNLGSQIQFWSGKTNNISKMKATGSIPILLEVLVEERSII
jgi:hypothetical protein